MPLIFSLFTLMYLDVDFFLLSCLKFPESFSLSLVVENYQPVFLKILPLLHSLPSFIWIKYILDRLTVSSISLILFSFIFILFSLGFLFSLTSFDIIFQVTFFCFCSIPSAARYIHWVFNFRIEFFIFKSFFLTYSVTFNILSLWIFSSLLCITLNIAILISLFDNYSIWSLCTSVSAVYFYAFSD